MCTQESHERLKLDAEQWRARTVFRAYQPTYDKPGQPTHLEMRNCECGSTLCVPVTLEGK